MSSTQAWIIGDGGTLLHSVDGGASFGAPSVIAGVDLRAIHFSGDGSIGAAVGDGGTMLVTHDGTSWQALPSAPGDLTALSISSDGQRLVAVGAAGLLWRSTDGAASWTGIAGGGARAFTTVGFSDDVAGLGWAAGKAGALMVTHDDGASFVALDSGTTKDIYSVDDL